MIGRLLTRLLKPGNAILDNPTRGIQLLKPAERYRAIKIPSVKTTLSDEERQAFRDTGVGRINPGVDRHIHRKLLFWFLGQPCIYSFPTLSRQAEIAQRCTALGDGLNGLFAGTRIMPFRTEFLVYNGFIIAATQDAKFKKFRSNETPATYNIDSVFETAMRPIIDAIGDNPLRRAPMGTFGCPTPLTGMQAFYYGTCAAGTPDDPTGAYDGTYDSWLTQRGCLIHFLKAHLHPWAGEVDGKPCRRYASDLRVVFYVLLKEWMARRHDNQGAQVCNVVFQVPAMPYTAPPLPSRAVPHQLYPPVESHT